MQSAAAVALGELGPGAEGAVVLAGHPAGPEALGHGAGPAHAVGEGRRLVVLAARAAHACGKHRWEGCHPDYTAQFKRTHTLSRPPPLIHKQNLRPNKPPNCSLRLVGLYESAAPVTHHRLFTHAQICRPGADPPENQLSLPTTSQAGGKKEREKKKGKMEVL